MPNQLLAMIVSLMLGYACGNFLTADIVSRAITGKTVFDLGVGNPGMANVGHELGHKAALIVLAGDILKTVLAWLLARMLFPGHAELVGLCAGLGATLGHNHPFWHHFKGGKGVATSAAAVSLTAPLAAAAAALAGIVGTVATNYLCYGAVVAAFAYWALIAFARSVFSAESLVALAFALLMVRAHWSSIQAARAGTQRYATLALKVRKRLGLLLPTDRNRR